jgi:hypothetical protein
MRPGTWGFAAMMRSVNAFLIAIASWHLLCLLSWQLLWNHVIGSLVVATYTALFGDPQASYGRFERIATYLSMLLITSTATLVTLLLFDRLSHRRTRWAHTLATFCAWQLLVGAILNRVV